MAEEKRYYWIKIKDSFMTSDKVDFLMSQKDGANYIVLYQMLCLMCLNTNGELSRKIGEIIIPYDKDKIVRDCKYFTKDTVIVALELFKKLGMIYEEQDGTLIISDFDNMVGSSKQDEHTKKLAAERQAKFRQKNKQKAIESVTVTQKITDEVTLNRNTDIRDKILDNNIYIGAENPDSFSVDKEISPMQQNYAKVIFVLWSNADLPCQHKNYISFIQKDFKDALSVIHEYKSDEIIKAANNYISVLKNPETWVDQELSFDVFVQTPKLFKMCLPDNFRPNNFLKKTCQNNQQQYSNPKQHLNPNLDNPDMCLHADN